MIYQQLSSTADLDGTSISVLITDIVSFLTFVLLLLSFSRDA